jgi:hypothetical protein
LLLSFRSLPFCLSIRAPSRDNTDLALKRRRNFCEHPVLIQYASAGVDPPCPAHETPTVSPASAGLFLGRLTAARPGREVELSSLIGVRHKKAQPERVGSAGRDQHRGSPASHQRRKRGAAGCTAAQRVAATLLASGMASTVTASAPRRRLRSSANSAHCSKSSVLA